MLYVVTGGSGSGKSAWAEELAVRLGEEPRIYLATMRVWDAEGEERVSRHRLMRRGRGFETVERPDCLENVRLFPGEEKKDEGERRLEGEKWPEGEKCLEEVSEAEEEKKAGVVLLECLSNLALNEFYRGEEGAAARILSGIENLQSQCRELIVVTNEIFSDGESYDPETMRYLQLLGELNRELGARADFLTEVVFGIPVPVKGANERLEGSGSRVCIGNRADSRSRIGCESRPGIGSRAGGEKKTEKERGECHG